jgi:hypothetical protein
MTPPEAHMLTATYSGDGQFEGSSSNELEHVVIAPEGAARSSGTIE